MKQKYSFLNILWVLTLVGCSSDLTMSAEEFLRSNAQIKDKNVQTSNFSLSYTLTNNGIPFDELKNQTKQIGSYLVTDKDEEGNYTYIPRLNAEKSFQLDRQNALTTFKISPLSSSQAYLDSENSTIYDSLGNKLDINALPDTNQSQEYSIVLAGDTALYEALTGSLGDNSLHIFNLAYIISNSSETLSILYKQYGDTEYLIPETNLLSYSDKLANMLYPLSTAFTLLSDGTYQTANEIHYYDASVVFSHVAKKDRDKKIEIDTTDVKGETALLFTFTNGASILYTYELVTTVTNNFDFMKDGSRYKIHIYNNKNREAKYEEVNKFPLFYVDSATNFAFSKDGTKCAVLCHQITDNKTISNDFSTITFSNKYKYGKFASELGIFSNEETYIRFGEDYYSYKSEDYDIYMYRSDDFAILKGKEDRKLDHKYLVVNSQKKEKKIFANTFSSLSTPHHALFYSKGDGINLQFNVLDTETLESTVIQDNEKKHIASLEYGLYWEINDDQHALKDFMGQVIIEGADLTAKYFYENATSPEYWILGKSYKFYTFYGSQTYSTTTEDVTFDSVYYMTNNWR